MPAKEYLQTLILAVLLVSLSPVLCAGSAPQNPGTSQPEPTLPFTIINEIDRPICNVYLSPVWQTNQHVERLQGELISPGEARTFHLARGMYTALLRDCQGAMVLFKNYLDVSAPYELHLTANDRRAAPCQEQNYAGIVFYGQDNYSKALEQFRSALVCFQAVPYRLGEGEVLNNLGAVYLEQGRLGDAMELFKSSLEIAKTEKNLDGESAALNGIATIYLDQWRYDDALKSLERVLAIRERLADPRGVAVALNNQGEIYRRQQRYEEAIRVYQRALAIQHKLNDRKAEGNTLNNIAAVYEYQGDYTAALKYYGESLQIARQEKTRGVESAALSGLGRTYNRLKRYDEALEKLDQALEIVQAAKLPDRQGSILSSKAAVYKAQGRYDEALANYSLAMDRFEAIRANAGSEAGKAGFIGRYFMLYDDAIELYYQQNQPAEAFFVSERARARAFLDSLVTGQVQLGDDKVNRLLDQEGYAAILNTIETRSAHSANLANQPAGHVLTVAQVQAWLDKNTTLISYYALEDKVLAFLITQSSFSVSAMDVSHQELVRQIKALRSFPNINIAHPDSAIALYNWLIEPLKDKLTTPHLIIIPHGTLHYLPFAALTDGEHYLIDHHVITLLPSASVLPFIQGNRGHKLTLPLILANAQATNYGAESGQFNELPFAEQEVTAIGKLYDVKPLINEAATESALREQAGKIGMLHLAAHGKYDPNVPLNSFLALAPDSENDGLLTVAEVYGLDLHGADLVVLSACDTHLGTAGLSTGLGVTPGDEVVGLTRAFFFSGTPSIIASLWKVDDRATAMLMDHFYTHLHNGLGKAAALRQAQLEVRDRYPSPKFWAAFVLSGEPGQIGELGPSVLATLTVQPTNTSPAAAPGQEGTFDINCLGLIILVSLLGVISFIYRRHRELGRRSLD